MEMKRIIKKMELTRKLLDATISENPFTFDLHHRNTESGPMNIASVKSIVNTIKANYTEEREREKNGGNIYTHIFSSGFSKTLRCERIQTPQAAHPDSFIN